MTTIPGAVPADAFPRFISLRQHEAALAVLRAENDALRAELARSTAARRQASGELAIARRRLEAVQALLRERAHAAGDVRAVGGRRRTVSHDVRQRRGDPD